MQTIHVSSLMSHDAEFVLGMNMHIPSATS